MDTEINIKAIRKTLGLTQSALGAALGGMHQGNVSRLERGTIRARGLVLRSLMEMKARAAEIEAAAQNAEAA
tara:strand:- start:4841 stop:5056 length:216 start_codon:yes stop_codon:yes gene_type:complete